MVEDEGTVSTVDAVSANEGESLSSPGTLTDDESEMEGLPMLLLRELASFRARFPYRVGKHLRADASKKVLKLQVSFFFFLLSGSV